MCHRHTHTHTHTWQFRPFQDRPTDWLSWACRRRRIAHHSGAQTIWRSSPLFVKLTYTHIFQIHERFEFSRWQQLPQSSSGVYIQSDHSPSINNLKHLDKRQNSALDVDTQVVCWEFRDGFSASRLPSSASTIQYPVDRLGLAVVAIGCLMMSTQKLHLSLSLLYELRGNRRRHPLSWSSQIHLLPTPRNAAAAKAKAKL